MTLSRDDTWIYTRRSRVSADQASIEDQESYGRAACAEHGWRLAGVLSEEVSASRYSRKERGDWAELLRLIDAGEVSILILWESNRGDRTLTSWSAFLDLCRAKGTRIYVVVHERLYDLRRARDWKTLASDGVDNAYFSEQLSAVTQRGKRAAMGKGRPASPVPYGYRVHYDEASGKTAGWRIVPEEAKVVRDIIRRVTRAEPVTHVAAALNERGIAAPWGGRWDRSTVRRVAGNCAYAGLVRLADGGYAERQPQKDGAAWPAIVTRAQWEAAVAVLSSRATGARPGAARHLLAGIARCQCGGWLQAHKQAGYSCRDGDMYILRGWLDEFVTEAVCARLARDDARDLFAVDDEPRRAALRSELKELTGRRSGFRKRAALGKISEDALQEIEDALNPEIASREAELGRVTHVPAVAELVQAGDVRAAWDSMTLQARRAAVAAVTGITVRKMPRTATRAERYAVGRVVLDWQPQPPRKGPGGRARASARENDRALGIAPGVCEGGGWSCL